MTAKLVQHLSIAKRSRVNKAKWINFRIKLPMRKWVQIETETLKQPQELFHFMSIIIVLHHFYQGEETIRCDLSPVQTKCACNYYNSMCVCLHATPQTLTLPRHKSFAVHFVSTWHTKVMRFCFGLDVEWHSFVAMAKTPCRHVDFYKSRATSLVQLRFAS